MNMENKKESWFTKFLRKKLHNKGFMDYKTARVFGIFFEAIRHDEEMLKANANMCRLATYEEMNKFEDKTELYKFIQMKFRSKLSNKALMHNLYYVFMFLPIFITLFYINQYNFVPIPRLLALTLGSFLISKIFDILSICLLRDVKETMKIKEEYEKRNGIGRYR